MTCLLHANRDRAVQLVNARRAARRLRPIRWHHLSRAGRAHFGALALEEYRAETRIGILKERTKL